MKRLVFHPFLFAAFPILSLYLSNADELFPGQLVGPLVGMLLVTALLWYLLNRLVPNRNKSALLTTMFVLWFLSFGHAANLLLVVVRQARLFELDPLTVEGNSGQSIMLAVWLLLLGLGYFLTIRVRGELQLASSFLNIVSITLVALMGFNFGTSYLRGADVSEFITSWHRALDSETQDRRAERTALDAPDVYYIIVDEYAREDVLAGLYHIDNSALYSYLASRGFMIAHKSSANYSWTQPSLASSLNFTYLDGLAARLGTTLSSRAPMNAMIQHSRVFQRFHDYGYITIAFASGYTFSEIRSADLFKAPANSIGPFDRQFLSSTALPVFLDLPFLQGEYDAHRERINYILDHLADLPETRRPIFVFAHIPAPHPPFVFGPNGEPVRPNRRLNLSSDLAYTDVMTDQEYMQSYIGQLSYVTTKLRAAIEAILSRPRRSIIVLQADHGPGYSLVWSQDKHKQVAERMPILNAYYLPEPGCNKLYQTVTPVNTFRLIFDCYFNEDMPTLADENYFSSFEYPYKVENVTEIIKALGSGMGNLDP